ncbi:efflux transporter outer membrane subunit [Reyranella sp.]|uniref:efflux transporter outer membrane subunit n=1 Tax=Reyranella sp. TaxID=1929291 RepID=UPI003BAC68EB
MRRSAALLPLLLVSGCLVGPDYERAPPASAVAPQYKEAELPPGAASLFRPAQPSDGADRGQWWRVYGDPTLDGLAAQVDVSNQNLKIFEANYRRARALIRQDQSVLYPSISGTGSAQQTGTGGQRGTGTSATSTVTRSDSTVGQFSTGGTLTWEIDLWGTLRRQVESDSAAAQASDADLANARLSAQTDLVTNYASLRISDDRKRLYEATVAAYLRSMQIAQNQVDAGIVSRVDLVQAQTQYEQTRAQLVNESINRALLEHAIALLVGKAPSEVTIEPATTRLTVPTVDSGVPSTLLERRPDIASAERQMAAANAQVGVAKGAYYPQISLGATIGFLSGGLGSLLQLGTAAWSVGPQIAGTLVDGGGIAAQVQGARAGYDATVATYRQTILTAFQQVEDALAQQRILVQQEQVQRAAVAAAREAERLSLNQYRVGTVPYTTVVQTQTAALSAEQTLLTIRLNRLVASANLVKALGGGWRQEDLPPPVPIGGLKQANPAPPAFPPPTAQPVSSPGR